MNKNTKHIIKIYFEKYDKDIINVIKLYIIHKLYIKMGIRINKTEKEEDIIDYDAKGDECFKKGDYFISLNSFHFIVPKLYSKMMITL